MHRVVKIIEVGQTMPAPGAKQSGRLDDDRPMSSADVANRLLKSGRTTDRKRVQVCARTNSTSASFQRPTRRSKTPMR